MIFADLKIDAELLKSGGLSQALADLDDESIQDLTRIQTLEIIKNDILIEVGVNTIDFDLLLDTNLALIKTALYHLQTVNILIELADNFSGLSEELRIYHRKEYDRCKSKFINLSTSNTTARINIVSNYL